MPNSMIYLTPNMRAYPPLCLETHRLIMRDRLIAKMVETAKKQRASQRMQYAQD